MSLIKEAHVHVQQFVKSLLECNMPLFFLGNQVLLSGSKSYFEDVAK